jgi:hypothetical protein
MDDDATSSIKNKQTNQKQITISEIQFSIFNTTTILLLLRILYMCTPMNGME